MVYDTLRCPAHAGPQPLAPVVGEPLGDIIRGRGSVHWLVEDEQGLACEEWRFQPQGERTGRLTRRKPYEGQVASFPFEYRPARGEEHASLLLATLEPDKRWALKCPCDMDYKLLRADASLLTMMGHPLPAGLTGYQPGEAERWFLDAEPCEQARVESMAALERDGTAATQLGFHAVFAPLGI